MSHQAHYSALESMYLAAPINQEIYQPTIKVSKGEAEIVIPLSEKFHHAGHAVHGSVYFKMLDDAAYFAANSMDTEFFVLTSSFTTYLTRPVKDGIFRAVGKVVSQSRTQFIAESVVYDIREKEVGRGNGIFVRGKLPLVDAMGYDLNL